MSSLSLDPAIFIVLMFALAPIALFFLYLREYNKRRQTEAAGDKFLESVKEKGWETLGQSIHKSEALLEEAELEGIRITAGSKLATAKFESDFQAQLSQYLDSSKQSIVTAQEQLLEFMQDLQKRSGEFEESQKQAGQQRINQLFDRVEAQLADFLVQTAQKTTSSIELELKASRELVETYKNEQLKLIDENIIAMMEQTLNIVLSKKLSLKDQLDLVYEALEKAKVEKFIV